MVPSFTGFPLGVTSGSFDATYDMNILASWAPGFVNVNGGGTVGGAIAALTAGLVAGQAYFNIHTTAFGGGEIRGFLVPEPGTAVLLALGLAGIGAARRRPRPRLARP
jgi:hypothetical protein